MYEYSWFIQRIKDYQADGWSRDAAITQAVKDCQKEGVLVEFINKHGSEVANMLYTQWNWDDAMAVEREEAYAEGVSQGMAQGIAQGIAKGIAQDILDLLEELGEIPEDVVARIQVEESLDTLRRWHKAAARVESFTDFREKMI